MANKIFGAIKTIGGTDGALDSIKIATLTDGDLAVVGDTNEEGHWYRFESSSTAAESDPQAVRPDDYSTAGVWILLDMSVEDLKVYGNAVIDGTLEQTGNANFSGNVDIDGTLTFDGAGPAVTVIKDEDDMASDSATALATQQSIKKYCDDIAGSLVTNVDRLAGFLVRPKFTWVDDVSMTIGPGRYHLLGTAQGEDIYKWDTALTYTFGSGGSNASSEDLGASEWHYLYIDDSALAGGSGTLLTAAQFINNTTAPTWDASECGWYNGADRCIAAFYSDSSSDLQDFLHTGEKEIQWMAAVNLGHSWTTAYKDQTMRLPALATDQSVRCSLYGAANNYGHFYWRYNGSSLSHWIGFTYNSGSGDNRRDNAGNQFVAIADNTQTIEFSGGSVSNATTGAVLYQHGYILPEGF